MNFEFTPEQREFQDAVRRFAQKHLAAGKVARAHNPAHPFDVAKLMAAQGLLGITMPEADGGQAGTLMDAVIAIETIASVCPRSADVVQAGNFGPVRVLAEYGTPQQKERYLGADSRRRIGDLGGHDRTRRGQRGHRPQDHGHAGWRRLADQRQQGVRRPIRGIRM